jgi:hypothetical protein
MIETTTPIAKEQKGLYHSNLVAVFDLSERREAFVARFANCVSRAFYAIGSSSETQEIVYWNLLITKNIRKSEIIDNPEEFFEGLQTIYGDVGVSVFEYMLRREIGREFDLTAALELEAIKEGSTADLVHLIASAELEAAIDP